MINRVFRKLIEMQFIRFLLVGAWNTLFGFGVFAVLTYFLTGRVPEPYLFASGIGFFICTGVAYLGHKFFTFRTKGNYLREYLKFMAVYVPAQVLAMAFLKVLVTGLERVLPPEVTLSFVPKPINPSYYLASIIIISITVICSFFGHKHFSFKAKNTNGSAQAG